MSDETRVDVLAVMRENYEMAAGFLTPEQASALFEKHLASVEAVVGLVSALEIYASTYSEHWTRGMPILEPISDTALARMGPPQ